MNILSVFDGMSCGRIALERAGIPVDNYYASEIDRFAISVSSNNYPDIIRLGDVRELDVQVLPHIDLLIGGSPCTNFSFAGKRAGMTTKCKEEILDLDYYLQTVPDNHTAGVSNSQRYKMLGNGWTVDVIAHIFRNIPWFLFPAHD